MVSFSPPILRALELRDAPRIWRKLVDVKWVSADRTRLVMVERSVVSLSILPVIAPMHPTLVREPLHLDGWIYEEKYDGWRMADASDSSRGAARDHTVRSGTWARGLSGAKQPPENTNAPLRFNSLTGAFYAPPPSPVGWGPGRYCARRVSAAAYRRHRAVSAAAKLRADGACARCRSRPRHDRSFRSSLPSPCSRD